MKLVVKRKLRIIPIRLNIASGTILYIIMNKIRNYIKDITKWIWQFPQNMLALCIESILCESAYREGKVRGNTIIVSELFPYTLSLGDYLFINKMSPQLSIQHEYGHSKQSTILGPMYLVIIGIPSIIYNIVYCLCTKIGVKWNYYSFYTEYWANKLVGIS